MIFYSMTFLPVSCWKDSNLIPGLHGCQLETQCDLPGRFFSLTDDLQRSVLG